MKNLKYIVLLLSCLTVISCTKDIDEKEPSNECSILDIKLTGQLGKATIERVDDNQGTVILYIFEQADYPWEAVGVEALALSAYATADVADGGTLFLDEIGNLPLHLQPKLLTALQSGAIVRVGSNLPVKVDCRLISATNRDLFGMTAGGSFREDLLYRINTIHIDLPPLRQRREDILPLAEGFLRRYAAKYGKPIEGFDSESLRQMEEYPWAGNIRELQHTIEKAVILCDGGAITPSTLLLRPAPAPASALSLIHI